MRPVEKQIIQLDLVEPARAPGLELGLDGLADRETVDFEIVACSPSASARAASTSRVDNPRTNPAMTRLSSAFVLVTPAPSSREANFSVVPRIFGRARVTGPVVVLMVVSA
jgi:hypothetical protein